MSMGFGSRRRGINYRDSDDGSPRATFRQLFPFLLEHKRVLSIVIALSVAGAITSLAQPLVVGEVITLVGEAEPLGILVWVLVGLVVMTAILSGFVTTFFSGPEKELYSPAAKHSWRRC